ncbi:hypothetical protein [Paenibacillus sp. NFR01]|uniref:hypothetical protein n=1 Tax=Paenibacillus sp. NFR01 TaxID=1566279 RepID=UPI0008B3E377|nr:hypothetical protein [Paenibacillus sp. NFR01]SET99739.1 phosphoglucomutase [Paenibacillus sp. NFR01]
MQAIAEQLEEILQKRYHRWKNAELPAYLSKELNELKASDIIDRFYQDLPLEEGGVRGATGVGTNRMNIYTIRRVCRGLAEEIRSRGFAAQQRGIAIGYDSHPFSRGLAEQAALVLANNEVKCYLFSRPSPGGELAFAVRYLHAAGGLHMTGGEDFSGCILYDEQGWPAPRETSSRLSRYMAQWEDGLSIQTMDAEAATGKGRLVFAGGEIEQAYLKEMERVAMSSESNQIIGSSVRILQLQEDREEFHPLRSALRRSGFTAVHSLPEGSQAGGIPAGHFAEQFDWRSAYAAAGTFNADLIVAFDPQLSRMALSIKADGGRYMRLSPGETAALALNYVLRQKKLRGESPAGGALLKSLFSGELAAAVARKAGLRIIHAGSGGGKAAAGELVHADAAGGLIGYDEDGGFTLGAPSAASDAIPYALLAAEMSAYYKSVGRTLHAELLSLYEEYGWYAEDRVELNFRGLEGRQRVSLLMGRLAKDFLRVLGGIKVERLFDFRAGELIHLAKGKHLPLEQGRADALKFVLEDGSWYGLRAGSAWPGLQLFFGTYAADRQESRRKLAALRSDVLFMLENML